MHIHSRSTITVVLNKKKQQQQTKKKQKEIKPCIFKGFDQDDYGHHFQVNPMV